MIRQLARLAVGLGLGAALFLGVGAATMLPATAAPQAASTTTTSVPYGPTGTTPTVTASKTSVTPGNTDTVCGTGFAPNATVTISLNGVPIGTTTSSSTGSWCATVTIPSGLTAGTYQLVASDTSGHSKSISIVVSTSPAGAAPTSPGGGLAFTGADIGFTTAGGAGILAVGGLLVLGAKRRKRE